MSIIGLKLTSGFEGAKTIKSAFFNDEILSLFGTAFSIPSNLILDIFGIHFSLTKYS